MRKALIALLLAASSPAFCQSVIRVLAWELDTARPAVKEWPLVRGETVDLECRYLAGAAAMDVRGAAVVLHCRTNGMPSDLSFQVTGRVGRVSSTNLASVGWVTVRVRPDLDLPHDAARCTFALETTLNTARNLVATGTLRLSGDPTGASPAALPIFQYDAKGSAQAVSNALACAVQLVITSSIPAQISAATGTLATTQQLASAVAQLVTTSQLSVAMASLPVPSADALRLVNSNATRWVDATGGVWFVTQQIAANKLLLDFSDNASFFSGQCSAIDTVVDVPCANIPCGQVLMSVGVGSWTMKNLFNTSSQIVGMFNVPVTFPYTVNFSGAHHGTLTFNQITEHLTNCVDAVVFNSALTGNALRLINPTNSAEWTDGSGDLWRVTTTTGWYFSCPNFPANDGFVDGLSTPFPEYFERSDARGALFVSRMGVNPITIEYLYDMGAWWGGFQDNGATSYVIVDGNGIYADSVLDYRSVSVTTRVDQVSYKSAHELHADSFTNLIWRTVWSNGWCWAVAYTNTP